MAITNEQAHESLPLNIWSGEEVDSEPVIGSQMGRSLGKQASRNPIPGLESPATMEMQIESDEDSYDGSGLLCRPSIPSYVTGDTEL